MNDLLLTLITFFPLLGMVAVMCIPSAQKEAIKTVSAVATAIPLVLSVYLYFGVFQKDASMQAVEEASWIGAYNIKYLMGVDGISLPLVFLTALLLFIAVFASWNTERGTKGYFSMLLLLQVGITGTFLALDFFLFYVFWEIMLLPMYFLIGIWGGPRREYAAIKFFLYTLAGSVLMLIGLVAVYQATDRTPEELVDAQLVIDLNGAEGAVDGALQEGLSLPRYRLGSGEEREAERVRPAEMTVAEFVAFAERNLADLRAASPDQAGVSGATERLEKMLGWVRGKQDDLHFLLEDRTVLLIPVEEFSGDVGTLRQRITEREANGESFQRVERATFDLRALQLMGHQGLLAGAPFLGWSLFGLAFHQWLFVFLFIGFAIKIPVFPFHTWLPDAHVEAPTAISVILAGILLKLGAYGMMRINFPLAPGAFHEFAYALAILGVINIVYGAFVAMAQTDFKKLVAYSSVSHMGYVLLGMAALTEFGMNGAALQLFNHGTSSAMLFLIVGVIYDRAHHRDLNGFGGLMTQMPYYGGLTTLGFFAALGLPGLAGFISEVMTLLGAYETFPVLVIISLLGIVMTAAFLLWTMQRVFLGPLNEKYKTLPDINGREVFCQVPLAFLCVLLGIVPALILSWMSPAVNGLVSFLKSAN